MCGIAGTLGASSPEIATAMSGAIAHRGPDDSGTFFDAAARVAFAHRRLSIIDISSCGHQPMSYADGRYQIVFNGEIYNFAALRGELEASGHTFRSHSDTEVVLAAYAEWGERSVERLRGMFAFAIFDREAMSIFLARDRFGIKPLYYCTRNGVFAFASELKALLAGGMAEPRLDAVALERFIALGSFPQPRTALRDVTALLPGHTMRVRSDGSFDIAGYWDLADASSRQTAELRGISEEEAARRLRTHLEEATRLHMIADVPVGAFLSGGIDSTAVVGLMTRASGSRIRTFSVGFDDDRTVADERRWARLTAERFNCEHSEVVLSGDVMAAQFDDIITAVDQPSLDGTNTFIVSRAAAKSVKVALSGLGGDELFAGYAHFRRLHRAAKWDRALGSSPLSLRKRAARHVPGRVLRDREFLLSTRAQRFATLRLLAGDDDVRAILNRDVAPLFADYESLLRDDVDDIAQTSYVEANRYLRDTLLRDADAMAMFSSLEVRPVLLDHVLAEFAFALPASVKLSARGNKPVLVDAVRDLLPPELLTREKTGFELPLQSWLAGPLRDRAHDAFSSAAARSIFSSAFLDETLTGLAAQRRPSLRIWAYLVLIEWMRRYDVTP